MLDEKKKNPDKFVTKDTCQAWRTGVKDEIKAVRTEIKLTLASSIISIILIVIQIVRASL